jgi:NTP pyrophosphatase (non-canonical NTP hydrolase)
MQLNEYQRLAARTINPVLTEADNEFHALHGMVGEIGELNSLYQKVFQGHAFDEDHAMSELGDLLWFIAEYCTAMGWELDVVAQKNINKLKARYPEGFNINRSLHRAEGDI